MMDPVQRAADLLAENPKVSKRTALSLAHVLADNGLIPTDVEWRVRARREETVACGSQAEAEDLAADDKAWRSKTPRTIQKRYTAKTHWENA